MPINHTRILKQGYRRSSERNGLILMGIIFVITILNRLVGIGMSQLTVSQQFISERFQVDQTVLLSLIVGGAVVLVLDIALLVVSIAAIRVFVSDETERLPRAYFTRNMVWAAINVVIGTIVFGMTVALGFVALIVPGIFLFVALAFWTIYVAVEDQNFIEAFRSSWELTSGDRLSLFGLGVVVVFLIALINLPFGFGEFVSRSIAGDIAALVFTQAAGAIIGVFSTAVLATAYTELTTRADEEREGTIDEEPTTQYLDS